MNSGYLNNYVPQIARMGKELWSIMRSKYFTCFLSLFFLFNTVVFFAQNSDSPETQKGKVFLNGKDTMMDIILDHSYGTAEQVTQKINDGELECYYLKDHDKLYQKFRVLEKASFIEDYWVLMICGGIVLLLGLVYFKRKPYDKHMP